MQFQSGDLILNGKYRVERLLGRGAFGEVYLVTHLALQVRRALKVLRRDAAGVGSTAYSNYRGRFALEAQLGARLNAETSQPHLVQVYDFVDVDGLLALEMEYAPGGSLAARLARNREAGETMAVDTAVRTALDVARGLAALHRLDILHRDVKPSNILFDAGGCAKLGDLGLAQAPDDLTQRELLGSQARAQPGTPDYMSPEQSANAARLAPPSDVYSLGLVLFEMLTGRLYGNMRPGTRVRSLREDVQDWLDDLVARMLADEPRDRTWDGAEVAEALAEGLRRESEQRLAAEAAGETALRRRRREAEAKASAEEAERVRRAEAERQRQAQEAAAARQDRAEQRRVAAAARLQCLRQRLPWLAGGAAAVILVAALVVLQPWDPVIWPSPLIRPSTVTPTTTPRPPTATPSSSPTLEIGSTWISSVDGMVQVYVPAGDFLMGSSDGDPEAQADEKPQRAVHLDAYWIDQTEVTKAQYQQCVDAGKCEAPRCTGTGQRNHPVVCVSWYDATDYCAWAGRRLPSEAEWEKAARGTDGRIYPWGNPEVAGNLLSYCDSNCSYGWLDSTVDDGYVETASVGSYPKGASPYGAMDLAGNALEWVADWYEETYYESLPVQNPLGPETGQLRILRGGSWNDYLRNARCACRDGSFPVYRFNYIGFRCARSG